MGYSGARGTLIYEKYLKSKISCQTPFHYENLRIYDLRTGQPKKFEGAAWRK